MADTSTSKFERRFLTSSGNPLLGATIELVPQADTYPANKISLIEHPTRKGWYYKDAVPMNEYKIYINGSLYTQNIFHAENILKYIREKFNDLLRIPSATIENGSILMEDLHSEVKALIEGAIQKSGDASITGIKEFLYLIVTEGFQLPLEAPPLITQRAGAIYWDGETNKLKVARSQAEGDIQTIDGTKIRHIYSMDSRYAEMQYLDYDESLQTIFKNEGYEILTPSKVPNSSKALSVPFVKRAGDKKIIIHIRSCSTGIALMNTYNYNCFTTKIFKLLADGSYQQFSSTSTNIGGSAYGQNEPIEIAIEHMDNGQGLIEIWLEVYMTSNYGGTHWMGIQRAVIEIEGE